MKINLNLSTVNGDLSEFQLIPSGIYDFAIVGVDWKETKKKDGSYLSLKLQVTEGEQTGKKISQNVTVTNPSEKAVSNGLETLKQIMTQIGHPNPNHLDDTDELINGSSFRAIVEVESYSKENGSVGSKSSVSKIISKDVALRDGDENEIASTRPEKTQPSKPPVIMTPAKKAPAPATPQATAPTAAAKPTAVPAWMAR